MEWVVMSTAWDWEVMSTGRDNLEEKMVSLVDEINKRELEY